MSSPAPPDLQIHGHGLAGALLAETAAAAGLRINVTHDHGPAASRVAAGLFTPVTGKRLIQSWRAEDALPRVHAVYPALETLLGQRFFTPLPTLRVFTSEKQLREYREKPHAQGIVPVPPADIPLHAPLGAVRIEGGGWVDVPVMLDALQARRIARGEWGAPRPALREVWATGAAAASHPLWSEAGWRNAHGDVLTVRIPDLPQDRIYNFDRFLLPLGNQRFRLGATYDWHESLPRPRPQGRQELLDALQSALPDTPFEVLDHQAGIRPVALARVPILGAHPDRHDAWIFNGFGSKGVLYAPWLAERLVAHWLRGDPLPKETLAQRRILRQRARNASSPKSSIGF